MPAAASASTPVQRVAHLLQLPPAAFAAQEAGDSGVPRVSAELWTSKQRQASSLHEVSYRACFKPQLPRFFIERLSQPGDLVYDPFAGRGTTGIEAALLQRRVAMNDVNPLSRVLAEPRLHPPELGAIAARLAEVPLDDAARAGLDLSMFYHPRTEAELVSLRAWLAQRRAEGREDDADRWIRMVATNRLTGHSPGFFSAYTLPPNQAVSQERQRRINVRLAQAPEYRDVRALIVAKSRALLRDVGLAQRESLSGAAATAKFLCEPAARTPGLADAAVQVTVTSPPFLDVVQYAGDNWLRLWFNDLDAAATSRITMARSVDAWTAEMRAVLGELRRVTRPGGWVAFEVGEVRRGKLRLDEIILPLGTAAGFRPSAVLINAQSFTKTANIWGVSNNQAGTNSNRIVLFAA